jgi:hypothetical protein
MMIRLFLLGEDFAAAQGALVQDADGGDVDQGLADPQVVGGQQPGWCCCWSVCWVTQSDPALQHALLGSALQQFPIVGPHCRCPTPPPACSSPTCSTAEASGHHVIDALPTVAQIIRSCGCPGSLHVGGRGGAAPCGGALQRGGPAGIRGYGQGRGLRHRRWVGAVAKGGSRWMTRARGSSGW